MKKQSYSPDAKYKKFVFDVTERLRLALNLHNYRVIVHFVERVEPYRHLPAANKDGYTAETLHDPIYLDINIWVSRVLEKKFNDGRLDHVKEELCHELVHQLTDPYYDFASKLIRRGEQKELININENTTQRITSVLMKHMTL